MAYLHKSEVIFKVSWEYLLRSRWKEMEWTLTGSKSCTKWDVAPSVRPPPVVNDETLRPFALYKDDEPETSLATRDDNGSRA
ncbi:hypothetical protein BHE74_00002349 [Ensete ventricosum]|nr:hypothetical protein BHE74_00002349 [Ensete ventricosum]